MAKLLIVEDERDLVQVMLQWMDHDHHAVDAAYDGATASDLLKTNEYDLVILDLGLPNIDGIDLLQSIRDRGQKTPIIIVSGRNTIDWKVLCLEGGADDYMTKPFHMKELVCRVKALIRRNAGHAVNVLRVADVTIDLSNRVVTKMGEEIRLTQQEFALLDFLIRHPNCSFTSNDLLARVWQSKDNLGGETVRQCVKRLRQKIGDRNGVPLIETTATGYRFYAPECMN